ncbi:MAG TPA: peroxidase family protein [Chthoniobacterales bacterium]|jgi:hypothetical protein|nr:peroxidase family protein [Chthoniobacterales bacterium]
MLRPPHKASSAAHYSRLFGGPFRGHDEMHLRELSARMKDIPENRRGRPRQGDLAPSAFVYLGQFLDHDLTRDCTGLENASHPPENTANLHQPRLNLESVYGGGPEESPELYDLSERGAERFLLGQTKATPIVSSTRDDLPQRDGTTLLADPRNDQHLIISQLHVAFLKFHNRIVDLVRRGELDQVALPNEKVFQIARRLTVWHYQWIVRNEFLSWFVLPEVLQHIERNGARFFKAETGAQALTLPIEFTQAVFRFGHSTVQPQYDVNRWTGLVRLRELIRKKPHEKESEPLAADRTVDWDRFTRTWAGNANFAENIDTLISEDMFDLPAAAMPIPFKTAPPPLPEMTLLRGSRIGLPSGQEACRAADVPSLKPCQIGFDDEGNEFLRRRGLHERTPLWYYILREAEVLGVRKLRGGECLGPLGSRVVAEVILGIMNADPEHYLNVDPNWKPLMANLPRVSGPRPIGRLRNFLAFANERQFL